jgi:hypothetical protein
LFDYIEVFYNQRRRHNVGSTALTNIQIRTLSGLGSPISTIGDPIPDSLLPGHSLARIASDVAQARCEFSFTGSASNEVRANLYIRINQQTAVASADAR